MENKEFYRYEAVQYSPTDYDGEYYSSVIPNPKIELRTFNLLKETLKGYWVGYGSLSEGSLRGQGRWVSKTAKKRYAYPTKEEALKNFTKRTEKRLKIAEETVRLCKIVLEKVKYVNTK
jgi:hypothetical protein